jgi:ribosome biogenesis SPOUT family RNA methylase Rps3
MPAVAGETDEILRGGIKGGWPPRRTVNRALTHGNDDLININLGDLHVGS